MAERRDDVVARLELLGALVPGCLGCRERYDASNPLTVFAPPHRASDSCESGRRPHCTCDRCF